VPAGGTQSVALAEHAQQLSGGGRTSPNGVDSYEEFLLKLVDQECDVRRQGRVERALRASNLPLEKTLEGFERKRLPRKVDAHISVLAEGAFLDSCENVLAFGPPGSGKTHLLCAIGLELIYAGRRVLFRRCDMLVQELLAAKADLTLPKLLKQWSRFDLLIIDDIGYVQQNRQEMEVLFNLLAHRYERGSVMITSNLPFSQWEQIFKDLMTTVAAIDRLVHHSLCSNSTSKAIAWSNQKNGNRRSLWRALKYECVYLHAFNDGQPAQQEIGTWLRYCNEERPDSNLTHDRTPMEEYSRWRSINPMESTLTALPGCPKDGDHLTLQSPGVEKIDSLIN
jgi:DNA replication protein DnaC